MRLREQRNRRDIANHEAETVCGGGRIKRHISAAGLEYGEQRHHHLQAAFHAQGHTLIGPNAEFSEIVGETVGAAVHLRVAELAVCRDQRDRLGAPGRLRLEQLMNAPIRGELGLRRIPRIEQLITLGRAEERQSGGSLLNILGHALQQPVHMPDQAFDAVGAEQIGIVLSGLSKKPQSGRASVWRSIRSRMVRISSVSGIFVSPASAQATDSPTPPPLTLAAILGIRALSPEAGLLISI